MFLTTTFTKNEFVTLFDSEPALPPPPPPSSLVVEFGNEVLKSISKLDVFRVFERVCDTPGVYVRFHDRVESIVFFTSPVADAHTIYDLLQHVRGVYGAFFLFAPRVNHPLCFHRDDLPTAADYNSHAAAASDDDQEWIDKIDDAVSFAECSSSWNQYKYVIVSRRHRDAVTAVVTSNCCLLMMMDDDRGGYTDRLLVPFVHYVPMSADGRDLATTLSWLRDNERAVSVIVQNARQHCLRHMTRDALAEATGKIMSARNYVLRPCRYRRTRPFPEFNFTLDWCGRRDFDSSHDLRLDELTANERHAAFVQTMVMMQFLQWHYCAYLSSFRLFFRRPSATTTTTTYVLRELYDHHFVDAPCSVYIRLDGLVYYVDADGLTNYADEIKHNYRDVVSYFKYDDHHHHDCGDTFARAFARFHERHAARASSYYQRRYPTPILKLDRSVRTSNYPLPFDHNTNKLVIYRQYQIYQATLNDVYRRAFRTMLNRKRVEPVTFNLMDTTAYDVARIKYGGHVLPRLPDANDTVHVRTIYEVMTVVSRVDRPHYVRMFKPMTDVDKVLYSISYAQLKTIIEFCEQ